MDRDELKKPSQPQYANTAQVRESNRALLRGITGREMIWALTLPAAVDVYKSIGAQPRSDVTGQHNPGMGADETVDGLSGTEEAVRAAAEDATEADDFDRPAIVVERFWSTRGL